MSMTASKSWRWLSKSRNIVLERGTYGSKMKPMPFMGILFSTMLFIVYRTTNYQYQHTELEARLHPFDTEKESPDASGKVNYLPRGIVQARSDLELRPLRLTSRSSLTDDLPSNRSLLAIPVGIKQKANVDKIVQKFLRAENFTVMLFHYDSNVDGWMDLEWSHKAIHAVAENQTKWWFAKRFLHPHVVSKYDYIFIWDEDLGVENFHPGRYLKIMKSEGLEISQPALDSSSLDIHHRITIRKKSKKVHRRIYEKRGSTRCSDTSLGPPCTGWVEGMAPVFSRSAWYCAWHLIQNDLVHGWGMDMKLGYCAQGDRTKKVGIIDSEYIVHQGVQTLGGPSTKVLKDPREESLQRRRVPAFDGRTEIRRQSTLELEIFKKRWERAAKEDKDWVDPYQQIRNRDSHRH